MKKEPRNKPSRVWPSNLQQGCQDHSHSGERTVWSISRAGKLDIHMQGTKLGPYRTPYCLKMDRDLNIWPKTITFLEENIGENAMTLDLATISWVWHLKYGGAKPKTDEFETVKLKNFFYHGTQSTEPKGDLWNGRIYLQTMYLIRG